MSRTTRSSLGRTIHDGSDFLVRDGETASSTAFSAFKKMCIRIRRSREKQALRENREPERDKNDYRWRWF